MQLLLPHRTPNWPKMVELLKSPPTDVPNLCKWLEQLSGLQKVESERGDQIWQGFEGSAFYFGKVLSDQQRQSFLKQTLPFICTLVLDLPKRFPENAPPLLLAGKSASVSLSRLEAASLIASMFLGIYTDKAYLDEPAESGDAKGVDLPNNKASAGKRSRAKAFNSCNCSYLLQAKFSCAYSPQLVACLPVFPANVFKLHCLLRYFEYVREQSQDKKSGFEKMTITILRNKLSAEEISRFDSDQLAKDRTPLSGFAVAAHARPAAGNVRNKLADSKPAAANVADSKASTAVTTAGEHSLPASVQAIEDAPAHLQIDFANELIGGHVLGSGCVQEEIRFMVNPECLVSMLLCEKMAPDESICIIGTERLSNHTGYGASTTFAGARNTPDPLDSKGRRACAIVAIDAAYYPLLSVNNLRRELVKAYAGFSIAQDALGAAYPAVATGNWGCGMFGGDPQAKAMLQWIAASRAGRHVSYFPFGEKRVKDLPEIVKLIRAAKLDVGTLWSLILDFVRTKFAKPAKSSAAVDGKAAPSSSGSVSPAPPTASSAPATGTTSAETDPGDGKLQTAGADDDGASADESLAHLTMFDVFAEKLRSSASSASAAPTPADGISRAS